MVLLFRLIGFLLILGFVSEAFSENQKCASAFAREGKKTKPVTSLQDVNIIPNPFDLIDSHNVAAIRTLLRINPEIFNITNPIGNSTLQHAIFTEHSGIALLLINAKVVNFNHRNRNKDTAFHLAVRNNNFLIARALGEAGVDSLAFPNTDALSPLELAKSENLTSMENLLKSYTKKTQKEQDRILSKIKRKDTFLSNSGK